VEQEKFADQGGVPYEVAATGGTSTEFGESREREKEKNGGGGGRAKAGEVERLERESI